MYGKRYYNINLLLLLFLLFNLIWAQKIEMEVGGQTPISIPGLKSVDYTRGPIEITQIGERLLIIAKSPGYSSIIASTTHGEERWEVYVSPRIEELRELLKDIEGLTFQKAGVKVIVGGKIKTDTDKIIFDKIMSLYPEVIDMTEKTDLLIEICAVLIEINPEDEFNFDLNMGSNSKIDTLAPFWGWFNKSGGNIANGFRWSLSVDVLKSISSLIKTKRAKVISSPRVITNNGKKAEILAGGEIPYTVTSSIGTATTEWKTYGIKMEVTPQRKITNEIFMELYVEASEPVGTAISSRNARIQVSVPIGNTLIIGGLYNTQVSRTTSAGCLLPLFSHGWKKVNREILICVTPNAPATEGIPIDKFKLIKKQDIEQQK